MMLMLLALMIILAVRSVTLSGAGEGLAFYLVPDFAKVKEAGLMEVVFAAMGQSFFTLSLGIGAIAIFGSYIDRSRSLTGEAVCVTVLDTCVALLSGFIIFPACFAFGVNPDSGPNLILLRCRIYLILWQEAEFGEVSFSSVCFCGGVNDYCGI